MDMIPMGHYKISQKLSSMGIYHSGLVVGLLAAVGTCMGSIGKQVPSPLHHHCATLVAASTGTGASGSICIAAHTCAHCAQQQAQYLCSPPLNNTCKFMKKLLCLVGTNGNI